MVAQIMHLPYLCELEELYELRPVRQLATVLEHCGSRFGVSRLFTEWDQFLNEDLDAVFVLTSGSHAAPGIAAAEAGGTSLSKSRSATRPPRGRHAVCRGTLERGSHGRIPEALRPGLREGGRDRARARRPEVRPRHDSQAPYEPYVAHHRFIRGRDITSAQVEQRRAELSGLLDAAIGPVEDRARVVYEAVLIDTMVHEFNLLRGVLGEPSAVRFASLDQTAVTVVLDFGVVGCSVTWLDLPGIADYSMEACFYDAGTRVRLGFPSPYLKNVPTPLEVTTGPWAALAS